MRVIFHRQIKKDLRAALSYYDAEGGSRLGDRFFGEVEAVIAKVRLQPRGFHFEAEGLRRAALAHFRIISSTRQAGISSISWCCGTTGGILALECGVGGAEWEADVMTEAAE